VTEENVSPKDVFKKCIQVGVVIRDIEAKIANLSKTFGIGPWRLIDFPPPDRPDMQRFYHGEPADYTARLAFADLGTVELELIEPIEGKSIWKDFLDQHGEGIHHIRFNTLDEKPLLADMANEGIEVLQWGAGTRPGTAYFYFGSEEQIGFTLEIMRAVAGTDGRAMPIGKVIQ
jgi:methylmalonyl-CoA/ethylmalonyl-CoA epimerase